MRARRPDSATRETTSARAPPLLWAADLRLGDDDVVDPDRACRVLLVRLPAEVEAVEGRGGPDRGGGAAAGACAHNGQRVDRRAIEPEPDRVVGAVELPLGARPFPFGDDDL